MFSLLNPIFLWAGAAALVPLVLHMMQKRRTVRVPFSTVRFLKAAQRRSSSRIRMENFVLWLIRTLLMLFLAMAFAMPMMRTAAFGKFLSRTHRDIAIILDGSYSMGYLIGKETVWDKAIQCAISIVEGLDEGDKVCIFMANDDVKPVIEILDGRKEYAIAQLRGLAVGTTSSQLCSPTLEGLSKVQETPSRDREIHIISDGQALPWSSFRQTDSNAVAGAAETNKTTDARAALAGKDNAKGKGNDSEVVEEKASARLDQWRPDKVDKKTAFFVTLVGASAPENVTPVSVEIQPPLVMIDTAPRIQVKLSHTGPDQNTSVTVFLDDKEVGSRAALLGEAGTEDIGFALPPSPAGMHYGRVQTTADNLPIDNDFYFLLRVRETLPSLCVGTDDDTFYLLKALNATLGKDSTMRVKRIGVEDLAKEDLLAYAVVFLCNGLPLPGQSEVLQLEQYVKNGGLLVMFPGDRAGLGDYQVMTCLPGMPSAVVNIPQSLRKKTLRWERPQHPILRTLKLGPGGAPVVTVSRNLEWDKLEEGAEPLVVMGDKDSFLLCRDFGRGRTLLFSVPADRAWSTFPLSPFYLPLLHQVVQYGAAISGSAPYLLTTRSLSLADSIPTATPGSILQDPNKNNVPIRSTLVDNKALLRVEDVLTPGIYRITKPNSTDMEPALALNLDRTESNLAPIKREEIPKLIGTSLVNVAGDKDELQRLIKDFRVGRTLGEVMLWLAFLLSILEVVYANLKSRAAPSLTSSLGIEASGKVTGRGE